MNFVKNNYSVEEIFVFKLRKIIYIFFVASHFFILSSGCSDKATLPSENELFIFENAGPVSPRVDIERLLETKINSSPYHVKPEEVLEITMPAILRVVTTDEPVDTRQNDSYICRISENGNITLPVIGEIKVAGKTLAQIESDIIESYYPEYILTRPSVFTKILEYKTSKVSIVGAVQEPGIYSLRSDQMSLVNLIMEAGGIIEEGAALIQILHSNNDVQNNIDFSEGFIKKETELVSIPINTKITKTSTPVNDLNISEVQLSFEPLSPQNTIGVLTISYRGDTLFKEQMDLSNEIERLVLLKQFSLNEPRVSIIDVELKLCKLVEIIKPGFTRIREDSFAYSSILKEIEKNREKILSLRQTRIEQEPKEFPQTAQQLFAAPKILERNESFLNNSTKELTVNRISSNPVLSSNYYMTNLSLEEEKDQRFYETFNMAKNQAKQNENASDEVHDSESFVLPVEGYNIPFADVILQDGDKVIVERLTQPLFSVIGLVNRPGNFPYPPNVEYNLMQAIAFAGGFNQTAEPRYVTVYRLSSEGTIVHATFEVVNPKNGSQLTDSLGIHIKPGDIVSVEHTPRTRTNVFFDRIFRINIGTYFNLNDTFDE